MLRDTSGSVSGVPERNFAWTDDFEMGARIEPPAGYRIVEVATESAVRVRDLASQRRDLELARFYGESYLSRSTPRAPGDRHADDALWMAALVLYSRPFKSSVRTSERLDPNVLDESDRARHQYLVDLRDKHIAHAVNDLEQTVVIAYLADSAFEPRRVSRIGQLHLELLAVDEADVHHLVQLCANWTRRVNRRLSVARTAVSLELAALGREGVYALPDITFPEIDRANVAKRRR